MVSPSFRATPFHREQERDVRRRDAELAGVRFGEDVRRTLYRYALIRNSWGTTNIDSGPVELDRVADLYEAYRNGVTRAGIVLPTDREVLNYFALVEDLPTTPFAMSVEDVRLLHHEYFRDVPLHNDARPGQWKQQDNVVRSPWHTLATTPKERVVEDLQALLDWVNGPGQDEPVLARAAVFFHGFQRIHPFADGNGRVGRLAALLLLSIGGLEAVRSCPVDDAINEDRGEYYRNLAAADGGDLETWVGYFGAQIRTGYQRAHLLARRLQRVPPSVPVESRRLLEWVYVHKVPSFRAAQAREFFVGASRATVLRRLKDLEALGLLRASGTGQGARLHVVPLSDAAKRQGEGVDADEPRS
jgi:Fic family protein